MCVACERVLHSRWTLIREWELRWYHERGVCNCEIKLPDPESRAHAIGIGADNESQSEDEISPGSSHTISPANPPKELNMHVGSQIRTELSRGDNKRPARACKYAEQNLGNQPSGTTVCPQNQYAVDWLQGHREMHALGRCGCAVDTKPMVKANTEGGLTADEEKVIRMHHQITGDGFSPEEWSSPSKEEVEYMRTVTLIPELGMKPLVEQWKVTKHRAHETTKYPVPLGNNMFLTEGFVVWDAKLLASRVESMQIASIAKVHGGVSSTRVPNGAIPAAPDPLYVYQPGAPGPGKEARKKRHRGYSHRDMVNGPCHAGLAEVEPPPRSLFNWKNPTGQTSAASAYTPMQHPSQHYQNATNSGAAFPHADEHAQVALHQSGRHGMAKAAPVLQDQQQMQHTKNGMTTGSSLLPGEQGNIEPNTASSNAVTSSQQNIQCTPTRMTRIEGAEYILGWYELTPPNTHAEKGMNGKLSTSSSTLNQTSTQLNHDTDKAAIHAAEIVNGTRGSPIDGGLSTDTGSGTTSTGEIQSKWLRKAAARKMRKIKKKIEEEKEKQKFQEEKQRVEQEKQKIAAEKTKFEEEMRKMAEEKKPNIEEQKAENDTVASKQRCNIPLCGLPIGAGPEGSQSFMPPFATCSLFYPAKKLRRRSSCPQFRDTQSLSSVSLAVSIEDESIITNTRAGKLTSRWVAYVRIAADPSFIPFYL